MKKQHEMNVEQVQMELSNPGSPRYHDMTPRRRQGNMEMEVHSRIDAMRGQHRKNMDKMCLALEDIKQGSDVGEDEENNDHGDHTNDWDYAAASTISITTDISACTDHPLSPTTTTENEKHIAKCVGQWKLNAKQFEKAKGRFASWKTNTSPQQQERRSHHFNFDDETTSATARTMEKQLLTSPRGRSIQELVVKNEELEEEMRQIRLLSPKKSHLTEETSAWLASLSPTSPSGKKDLSGGNSTTTLDVTETMRRVQITPDDSPQYHIYTPSSARYTTPRSNNNVLSYSSEAAAATQRSNNLPSMISTTNAQKRQKNTRISGLIADYKHFLEENDSVQERLSEDILALKA
mmetsp:Transcript_26015/g.46916  ORF Transcript_26015/g.46916 Transcript_26015/m.46916 type:complete len:350 (+) Transcript_26015:1-1050(+)